MRFFIGLLLLITSFQSFALARSGGGGMATGGGAGVVCRDKNSAILSVQLLDLYEAQVRDHLALMLSTGNAKKDYFQSILRNYAAQGADAALIPSLKKLQDHYYSFFSSIRWTSAAEKIPLLRDQGSTIQLPNNCALEQIALFHDGNSTVRDSIEMDSQLWEKLQPLHQAALIWHEQTYRYYRILGDTDSEITRAEVASIFTANKKSPVLDGIPKVGAILCTSVDPVSEKISRFFIFPSSAAGERNKWIWQFTQVMGRPVTKKTFAVLESGLPSQSAEFKVIGQDEEAMIFPRTNKSGPAIYQRSLITGILGLNLELLLESQPGEPVQISVYQKEKLLGSNFVNRCSY